MASLASASDPFMCEEFLLELELRLTLQQLPWEYLVSLVLGREVPRGRY